VEFGAESSSHTSALGTRQRNINGFRQGVSTFERATAHKAGRSACVATRSQSHSTYTRLVRGSELRPKSKRPTPFTRYNVGWRVSFGLRAYFLAIIAWQCYFVHTGTIVVHKVGGRIFVEFLGNGPPGECLGVCRSVLTFSSRGQELNF
jgi:hypothetical protein